MVSRRDPMGDEADFYGRKTAERAYIGEAYNGATKDWAIVDVPPGTNRVRMEGIGGGAEEITWQRYNGVRRSNFIPEIGGGGGEKEYEREREPERERERDRGGERESISIRERGRGGGELDIEIKERRYGPPAPAPPPEPKPKQEAMWTEITKDLVIKEAIEGSGYEFEETEFFFYVMDYLRYVRPFPPRPHPAHHNPFLAFSQECL